MRICYCEEGDVEFRRWTGNLLKRFVEDGRVLIVGQHEQPDLMLASIWRGHEMPAMPVVLISNENWKVWRPHHPLDRYKAVIGIQPPDEVCNFIRFPYAAVHFTMPVDWIYQHRHLALQTPKARFCCMVVSNALFGEWTKRRLQLAQDIRRIGPVDSAGRVENNVGYLAPLGLAYLNWISSYKYMICLENSAAEGYVTEKPLQAWFGGAVPIYDGGGKGLLNPGAFIDAGGDVIAQIQRLEADPEAYEAMRGEPLTAEPLSLAEFERAFEALVLNG